MFFKLPDKFLDLVHLCIFLVILSMFVYSCEEIVSKYDFLANIKISNENKDCIFLDYGIRGWMYPNIYSRSVCTSKLSQAHYPHVAR